MKATAEKSSTTTSRTHSQTPNRPFFGKAGGGGFFESAAHLGMSGIQFKMKVGQPGDPFEREADRMADKVMRMPTPASPLKEEKLQRQTDDRLQKKENEEEKIQRAAVPEEKIQKAEDDKIRKAPAPEEKLQRKGDGAPAVAASTQSAIQHHTTGGQPLSSDVRSYMEPRFGADFSNVRIHSNPEVASLSNQLSARAFTFQNHVFFSGNQYQPGTSEGKQLLAHELTHTLQQGGGVQRRASTGPLIQRQEKKGSWWDDLVDFGETAGWRMMRELAPALVPIVQKGPEGVFDWLKERASSAVEGVFTSLMAPVRAITGVGQQLSAHFAPLLASIQTAATQIAQNDCTPLRDAAEKIEKTAERLITPIVEKLQPVVVKVKDFLNGLWDKFGAPVWDWIKQYATAQWEQIRFVAGQIQVFASWIWDKTASVRALADKAWTWLKNKLGIGEGPEGQDGILQWVQRKLDAAWTWLKAKLEPFKKELTTIGLAVGGVALALSPAGPIVAIGGAIAAAAPGLRWIYNNWGKGNLLVQARVYIERTLIPPLQGAANRLGAVVTRMAGSLSTALHNFASGMNRAVDALGGSLLRFAVSAVQWLADQVTALADWARQELGQLSQWVTGALDKLQIFLHQMLNFFAKVGKVVLDIWGLPVFLAEKVWNWVPACVRDPIVDFLGPIILRQIEIFQELVKDNEAWQKTKAEVGKLIRLVFKDHDLMGAVKATFYLILRVFNLPPDLLATVARKAVSAWDVVIKKPLNFIKNTVRAVGHGFRLLWANIKTHLAYGVEGWLFGELKEKNITPPASWTDLKEIFFFVLSVLGLTVDHVYELLKKRFDEKKVDAFRKRVGQVARVLDWVNKSIDTTKSPRENVAGMIGQAKEFGKTILTGIAEWIAAKIAAELAILAAAAAASAGLSEVLDIARRIYKAILTAVRWARRILDMANEALDNVLAIASGAIEPVGIKFKDIMHRGMPVVIGFLADQVGLGGVGQAVRGIVDKLRAEVDKAILWFIDKIKAGIEALIGAVKAGVSKVLGWLGLRKEFTVNNQPHSLSFDQNAPSPTLVLATTPVHITSWLNVRRSELQAANQYDATKERANNAIQKDLRTIGELTYKPDTADSVSDQEKIAKTVLDNIAANVAIIGFSGDTVPMPRMVVTPGFSSQKATNMTVQFLFDDKNNHRPGDGVSGYEELLGAWAKLGELGITRMQWKSGHMLNANFGGLPENSNLIPIPTEVNNAQRTFDGRVTRELYEQRKPIWMRFIIERGHPQDVERHFVSYFKAEAAEMPLREGVYETPAAGTIKFERSGTALPYPALRPARVTLNGLIASGDQSRTAVAAVAGATQLPARVVSDLVQRGIPLKNVGEISDFINSKRGEYTDLQVARYLAGFERTRHLIVL